MANCVNCGTKLNSFNETYPLWAESQEKFCTRCNSKFQKFLSNNKLTHSSKLTRELFISQADSLRQNGFTDEGIRYINDYISAQEAAHEDKIEKEKAIAEENEKKERAIAEAKSNWEDNSKDFLETTGFSFEGYKIIEYRGIRSGEIVLGTGFLSEFSAGINDLFGTASNSMASKLTAAKNAALEKLKESCLLANANAVIGVDIDISIMGQNMILACANGTAVRIEKI